MDPWFHGSMDPWICGSMDRGFMDQLTLIDANTINRFVFFDTEGSRKMPHNEPTSLIAADSLVTVARVVHAVALGLASRRRLTSLAS